MTTEATVRHGGTVRADQPRPLPDLEAVLALIVAGFDLLFTSTTLRSFALFERSTAMSGVVLITALVTVPLVLDLAAALTRRAGSALWGASAAAYLLAILLWPLFIVAPLHSEPGWLLPVFIPATLQVLMATRSHRVTVLLSTGLLGCLLAVQITVAQLPPLVAVGQALLVAPFALLLTTAVTVLRRVAARTAQAQQASLARIASARHDDITEVERVRTDALVHDTVLTTLLQAASAVDDAESERAERMARNALRVLAHVRRSADLGVGVRLQTVLAAKEHALHALLPEFQVVLPDQRLEDLLLPADAADALLTAMTEAMDNTLRHAGAHRRTMRLSPLGPDGVRIEVEDDGRGFEYPAAAGAGIRARIVAPLMLVEGRSEILTAPGNGTSVRLYWGSVSVADVRTIESRMDGVPR